VGGVRLATSVAVATAVALIAVAAISARALSADLGVLVPVQQDDHIETKQDPAGTASIPVLQQAPDDALRRALITESKRGTVAFVLKLDEEAQRLSGQTPQPTWLMLTEEEGGFAKRGFWLRERSRDRFVDQPYVALVVDSGSIADGSFEEIFAHETGHVLLRRLIPHLPRGMSRLAHGSLTVTDDPTAFDEGFAIHFQALSRLMTVNPALKAHDAGIGDKPFTSLWQSNVDGALRIDGVRRNWFIHRQLLPPGDDDAFVRRANSSVFDIAWLKSGNQMLASEGVVATVFYRALAADLSVARYASLFRALQQLNSRPLLPDSPLLPMLAQSWTAADQSRGASFTKIFIETTYGASIDRALPQAAAALAQVGRAGDQKAFVEQLKRARLLLTAAEERVNQQSSALTAALGPAIWLAAAPTRIVNLNTAEADQLVSLDNSLTDWADKIVAERESHGPYGSLPDLARRVALLTPLVVKLNDMAAMAVKLGTYRRL
jgi:DNA uptake protein ComE-like DNA-binding protein